MSGYGNFNVVDTGPEVIVHHETDDPSVEYDYWWAECPACPGWTAWDRDYKGLVELVIERHNMPNTPHRAWHFAYNEPFISQLPAAQ